MPHRAARWIRRITKRWQRNSELIMRRASEYAASRGFRFVTCGHTHLPLVAEHDGVLYINSGTWTEAPPCPFVVVQGDQVRLEQWPLPHLAAGEEPVAALPSSKAAPPGAARFKLRPAQIVRHEDEDLKSRNFWAPDLRVMCFLYTLRGH